MGNTQKAYCEDLYEWWMWLSELKKEWDHVGNKDIIDYRNVLQNEFSPHTHRRYRSSTIRRRLSTILDYYRWAFNLGLIKDNLDLREIRRIPQNRDRRVLAHLDIGPATKSVSTILPKQTEEELIDPFNARDLKAVLHILGAIPPTEAGPHADTRPVRDRLIAELQVTTGMRIDEVLSLTVYQILGLPTNIRDPYELTKLKIDITKGLTPRIVLIPGWVRKALPWYIDNERKPAVEARTHTTARRSIKTDALFVNGLSANHRDVGNRLRPRAYMRVFSHAVRTAGLVHQELHRDPATGTDRLATVVNHTSHDLRHTFAVQTYRSRKSKGDAEPWKVLQVLLGHKQLSTTIDIYLRAVNIDEAKISDNLQAFFRKVHRG